MRSKFLSRLLIFSVLLAASSQITSQTKVDSGLLEEINRIRAIDNHSHAERVLDDGEADTEGDAISCGGLEFISPPPMRLRLDNPIYTGAWRDLFGYRAEDMSAVHTGEYLAIKKRVMKEQGDGYPVWILDKLKIDVMLANRVTMGRGLDGPRFRWVSYGDPLLLPFNTATAGAKNSDTKFFYSQEEKLFKRFLSELKVGKLPLSLDLYLAKVATPALERQKRKGSVALKFVTAYYRSLDFEAVSKREAAAIYAKYARGGEPRPAEYKKFQDHVFRYLLLEAGRLGLPVHIHTGGGCGHYFNLKTSNPILLEPVINDPAFRKTTFVLIHGGYPYTAETAFLLEKPNVYADFSAQTFLLSPAALSKVLRSWLEYEPEKILFGTDASPATPEVGWEESAWLTSNTARQALAIALTGMIEDKEITRARASELAAMVMRGNAAGLYGIKP
jgi:uncharacterized protein